MTTKILTFRIPLQIYSSLCISAAELGVPVSAHVRRLVEQEHQAEQIRQLRTELFARLDQLTAASAAAQSLATPSSLDEVLLLTRATAAHLNPHLVAQVRAKLALQQ